MMAEEYVCIFLHYCFHAYGGSRNGLEATPIKLLLYGGELVTVDHYAEISTWCVLCPWVSIR